MTKLNSAKINMKRCFSYFFFPILPLEQCKHKFPFISSNNAAKLLVCFLFSTSVKPSDSHLSIETPRGIYFTVGQEFEVVCNVQVGNETNYKLELETPFPDELLSQNHTRFKWEEGEYNLPLHQRPAAAPDYGVASHSRLNTFENVAGAKAHFKKLLVKDAQVTDSGVYKCSFATEGKQEVEEKEFKIFDHSLLAEPTVSLNTLSDTSKNCMANETCELSCTAEGNPPPEITWFRQECGKTPSLNCSDAVNVPNLDVDQKTVEFSTTSTIKFAALQHAKYTCHAKNSVGESNGTRLLRVVDYLGPGWITIISPEEIVEGDDVELVCAASKLIKTRDISWIKFKNSTELSPPPAYKVSAYETQWSYRSSLSIKSIQRSENGSLYHCKTFIEVPEDRNRIRASTKLTVLRATSPTFKDLNLNHSIVEVRPMETINLTCVADGKPNPVVTWLWTRGDMSNMQQLKQNVSVSGWSPSTTFKLLNNNTLLMLQNVSTLAQGIFKCVAKNRIGLKEAFLKLIVTDPITTTTEKTQPPLNNMALAIILLMVFAFLVFGGILGHSRCKEKNLITSLKEITEKEFYDGAVENINPDLSVADQAYLLPFDNRWEFPKERLKLGIQLGSGAFGRVVKAEANGIVESEKVTTVAVKMVKPNAAEVHFKALMSELKIMVHMGKHVNVVNLLGACTKNLIKKGELLVIVEYCKYGSLLSYMHMHKGTFINQLDGDRIKTMEPQIHLISRTQASTGYQNLGEFEHLQIPSSEDGSSNNTQCGESSMEHDCRSSELFGNADAINNQIKTESDDASQGPVNIQQLLNYYSGDYLVNDVTSISTSDLLSWAFQIAQGMEYLASRKILHGDLAARNVLLAENNIVKICDFGLAKEMYKDYKYNKKSEVVILPVKWMAVESMQYGVFSTQSDCWSFGVLMWELFTLGKTPYPGMEADEHFCRRIVEGYRMEKPPFATSCIYDLMLECWAHDPKERPSFTEIVARIGDMMDDSLRNYYIQINHPYVKINQTYLSSGGIDYIPPSNGKAY